MVLPELLMGKARFLAVARQARGQSRAGLGLLWGPRAFSAHWPHKHSQSDG